jgi:ABC-type branched-subunit amino acid transport system substrate-binding protein
MAAHSFRLVLCILAMTLGLLTSGCAASSPQVVKIGFVAPFEGRYREIGVDTIPAARLAIREWSAQHSDAPVAVELVAYDDAGDPQQATEQARKLIQDPDVRIVIGHWREDTTAAAIQTYQDASIPVVTYFEGELPSGADVYNLAPSTSAIKDAVDLWTSGNSIDSKIVTAQSVVDASDMSFEENGGTAEMYGIGSVWGLSQYYSLTEGRAIHTHFASGIALPKDMSGEFWTADTETRFEKDFGAGSLGAPPGFMSAAAYEATWFALDLLGDRYQFTGSQSPASDFKFDPSGHRLGSPIYLYEWSSGQRLLIATLP